MTMIRFTKKVASTLSRTKPPATFYIGTHNAELAENRIESKKLGNQTGGQGIKPKFDVPVLRNRNHLTRRATRSDRRGDGF
jgi:hypothetical protein